MKPVVCLHDVSFSYGSQKPLLENVNFDIGEGTVWGLIGPNGSGKTTLIKIILGQLKPSTGHVTVFGKEPGEELGRIGYVPQAYTFRKDFPITVEEVVLTGLVGRKNCFGFFNQSEKNQVRNCLASLGVENLSTQKIQSLSGGELQRVLLARALVNKPQLVILDETFSNLDPKVEEEIFQILKNWDSQMTVLLVSHNVGMITHHVGKVACLNRKIVIHETQAVDSDILKEVYGSHIRLISHSHSHVHKHDHGGGHDD